MHWAEILGYIAALLTLIAFQMKTMIPLRIIGMCANCFFIAYGIFNHTYPALVLHTILLPLNGLRLYQMMQLVEKVKAASQGDLNMNWLKPFMNKQLVKAGDVIFRKGDVSSSMFYSVTGRYRLTEISAELGPGEVIGEVGLLAPDNKRTLTFECIEDGELLTISYGQVKQLYFQNPQFGFFFLQLISQRLFKDIARLEEHVARAA